MITRKMTMRFETMVCAALAVLTVSTAGMLLNAVFNTQVIA
jgi:hypothetical protein